jgi:hypothetical protein
MNTLFVETSSITKKETTEISDFKISFQYNYIRSEKVRAHIRKLIKRTSRELKFFQKIKRELNLVVRFTAKH